MKYISLWAVISFFSLLGFLSGENKCQGMEPKDESSSYKRLVKISKPAPKWEGTAVVDGKLKTIKLTDYLGKYLILLFYPLDFTFVCPTELTAFSDHIEDFQAINTEVVACSVDSHFAHLAWISTYRKTGGLGPLKLPLLSDVKHHISQAYGVYAEEHGHALRGLFIIDGKGIVRQMTINDLTVGRSVDETLRLVQAFRHTDTHGEGEWNMTLGVKASHTQEMCSLYEASDARTSKFERDGTLDFFQF